MKAVIDNHCDVLWKMHMNSKITFSDDKHLDVTLLRLIKAKMMMQNFAIFISDEIENPRFDHILEMIDLFHSKILTHQQMLFIRNRGDLVRAKKSGKIGALLSLEGAEGIMGSRTYLHTLYYLGVRVLGITWNYANWAADGVKESRLTGFSVKGRAMVKDCERLGIILDVSHLSEPGFWELVEMSSRPFIATHSNVYEVCAHPRNLKQDQIKAIIAVDGRIGITFVPYFVSSSGEASIHQLLLHIDRICSLGGVKHIGFGSDFDGITKWIAGLRHPGEFENLADVLSKYYKPEEVDGFLYGNWYRFYTENLPEE
ncbi:dipeptidase [Ferviditalea candida]|uniref:Dipeptidase n=1 Tax=Ferviditalea candida TaxID=3108399 RepID=A0ABU5ZLV3_9BACL|nr:dipeptidase [Paenibacillaceae bacterium T2]